MLGRFQNFPVPVLKFFKHSVPVSTGSAKSLNLGSGSGVFGSTVLSVLNVSFFSSILRQNHVYWLILIKIKIIEIVKIVCIADNLWKLCVFPFNSAKLHISSVKFAKIARFFRENCQKTIVSGTRGSQFRFRFLNGFHFCPNNGFGSFRFPKIAVRTVGSSV